MGRWDFEPTMKEKLITSVMSIVKRVIRRP